MTNQENPNNTTKKHDFIELEFVGRNLQNNEVFDTNIKDEAQKMRPDMEVNIKPLIIRIGEGMVVKGFDEALENKELGKKYSIKVSSEKAFGKRHPNLIKLIPMRLFAEQKVYPQPGMTLALDNTLVKVVSVSSGRVMVDFNNPLAGKDLEYDFTIKKIVHDIKEKAKAVQLFLFGQEFEFDVDEKNKKIIFKDIKLTPVLGAFKHKFKEMLDMDVEIFEKKKSEEKTEQKK